MCQQPFCHLGPTCLTARNRAQTPTDVVIEECRRVKATESAVTARQADFKDSATF